MIKHTEDVEYIGDGVYVDRNEYGDVVLTTENGVRTTNTIVLEPIVWEKLSAWVSRVMRGNDGREG